jgi:hypothetical protein
LCHIFFFLKVKNSMISRLLSLLQILQRGGSSQRSACLKPNSYAVIQLWKRYFESQEQQINESISIVEEVLYGPSLNLNPDDGYHGGSILRPILSEVSERARQESVQEYYRTSSSATSSRPRIHSANAIPSNSNSIEDQQLHHPNLDIPSANGDSYLSLAQ